MLNAKIRSWVAFPYHKAFASPLVMLVTEVELEL